VSLLADLDAFSTEHRRCRDLNGGVDRDIVSMACDCGAGRVRRVAETTTPVELELDARGCRLRTALDAALASDHRPFRERL
jgi:hypothetical protein